MRALFVLATPEYFRYYESVIHLLAERGHHVLIATNRQNPKKPGLSGLGWQHPRVEFAGDVPRRGDAWEGIARGLRGIVDFSRYLEPRYRSASALRDRMQRKSLPAAFQWLNWLPSLPPWLLRPWLRVLEACEEAIPPSEAITTFVQGLDVSAVFVSPLVDFGADQVDTVKSAHRLGLPVAACIASWDNLTNKGLMRVVPERVCVWNAKQVDEAVEMHGVPAERVTVTGAQLFDRWFSQRPTTTRDEFCALHGFDPAHPIVLYTCSSSFIAPAAREVAFVRKWLQDLRTDSRIGHVNVLVRPHPYNVWDWETADLTALGPVSIAPRRAYDPLADTVRDGYFDALFHSAAVVGVNTSAMIEAAILGRPVLSILAPEFAATQEGTLHFRHLLPENGGFLQLARTLVEHRPQLVSAVLEPALWQERTARFVDTFIRPHGRERPCTPILADCLEQVPALAPSPDRSRAPMAMLVRGCVRVVAAAAWPIEELASEKPFGTLRKQLRKSWHQRRKEMGRVVKRWT